MNKNISKNPICGLIVALGLSLLLTGSKAVAREELRIYLPGEKTLSEDIITLGQVAMVLGEQSLAQRVEKITLGQFAMPGQELQIDRKTVLSRIAGEGVKASIHFNGAESIRLRREGDCLQAEQFVAAAESYLTKALSGKGVQSVNVLRSPDHFPLSCDSGEVSLNAHMTGSQTGTTRRVTVSVMHKNVQLCQRDVIFTIHYQCQRLVAAGDLPARTLITSENTRFESYVSSLPQKKTPAPYGMMTRRAIAAGTEITPNLVESEKPLLLVKRRQKVLLRLETGGLLVSAQGEAMDDGCVGDLIEVKRGKGREQRTILGKVMLDGTVEPVL